MLRRGELPRIRVLVRLAPGDDALVIARSCGVVQLTLELHLHTRTIDLTQPRLNLQRSLRRPDLEHLAAASQRFAHRAAAVHLIADHLGTSW